MLEERSKKVGQYEYDSTTKPLGRGRMSFVFRGKDLAEDNPVAVKVINYSGRDRPFDYDDIKHDIHFLQQLPSDHVVKFVDLKLTQSILYIVTELCEGETLAQYLSEHHVMSEDQALNMISQVVQAFSDVEEMSKKHSDFKFYQKHGELYPSKIMLLGGGVVKVADFGISPLIEKIIDVMMITQYIPTRCSAYESPQRLKLEKFSSKCDVWAAGIILYQAICGTTPWGDNTYNDQMRKIEQTPLTFNNSVSADVQDLIRNMLKIEEKERYSWEQVREHPAIKKATKLRFRLIPTDTQKTQEQIKVQEQKVPETKKYEGESSKQPDDETLEHIHATQDPTPIDKHLDPIGILASLVLSKSGKNHKPNPSGVMALANKLGMSLSSQELKDLYKYFIFLTGSYDSLSEMSAQIAERSGQKVTEKKMMDFEIHRGTASEPHKQQNLYNAWLTKVSLKSTQPKGKLVGKTIVLNDTISIKGLPQQGGSKAFSPEPADSDAFVALKALSAGAEIVGKANCESFQLSGNSFMSDFGPVVNPLDESCQVGGACSGCAVIVAQNQADFAIASDFDGSGRLPAAYCGVYAMKPTLGLIPTDGVILIDEILDQVCLMSNSVSDNALLLEALTEAEEEKRSELESGKYTNALEKNLRGFRIGLLEEGFNLSMGSFEAVDTMRRSLDKFEALGASLVNVSNPMHAQLGPQLWTVLCSEGFKKGLTLEFANADKNRLGILAKLYALVGKYGEEQHQGQMSKKAVALIKSLSESYDKILKDCDVIVMPTSTLIAPKLPQKVDIESGFLSTFGSRNTLQFNVTGHPAMQIPCGKVCGMPVGLTIVGRHFDEKTVYRVAYALQDSSRVLEFD